MSLRVQNYDEAADWLRIFHKNKIFREKIFCEIFLDGWCKKMKIIGTLSLTSCVFAQLERSILACFANRDIDKAVETNKSLLDAVRENPEADAWFRLVNIYDPLIAGWLRRSGVDEAEVPDISQEVLVAVVEQIKKFEHNGQKGAFRNWLKRITYYRCQRFWENKKTKAKEQAVLSLGRLEDPKSELSQQWDLEHDQHVLSRILQLIESEFSEKAFQAFRRTTIQGEAPADVAADLNISTAQIYKYRFRIMKRLKEDAAGLVDEGSVENLLA